MSVTAVWKRMDFSRSSFFWESVYKNHQVPILYNDNSSIFYGSKLVHTTCLYLIHAYIENKMHFNDTSQKSLQIQQLKLYLLSIINSINTQEIDEMYIINKREKLLSQIQELFYNQPWYIQNQLLFDDLEQSLCIDMKLLSRTDTLGLIILGEIPSTQPGITYAVGSNSVDNKGYEYELVYFDDVEMCLIQEQIFNYFASHPFMASSFVPFIRFNNKSNGIFCDEFSSIIIDRINGKLIGELSDDEIQSHTNGLLGFVTDLSYAVLSVFGILDDLQVVHGGIDEFSIKYDSINQKFIVTEWNMAQIWSDINIQPIPINRQDSIIGPDGYQISQHIKSNKYDKTLYFTLGQDDDIYSLRCLQIDHAKHNHLLMEILNITADNTIIIQLNELLRFSESIGMI